MASKRCFLANPIDLQSFLVLLAVIGLGLFWVFELGSLTSFGSAPNYESFVIPSFIVNAYIFSLDIGRVYKIFASLFLTPLVGILFFFLLALGS